MTTTTCLADRVMDATARPLANLAARWRDEREHEPWREYDAALRKIVRTIDGATFIRATKQPFGFRWRGDDGHRRHTFIRGSRLLTQRLAAASPPPSPAD